MAHTHEDLDVGGRFAKQEGARPQVIGTDPIPKYPQLPSGPWSGDDPVPDEPPLGYRIDEMIPLESPTGVQPLSASVATDGPPANEQSEADLAVSFDRGDGGPSPLSNGDPAPTVVRSSASARNAADVPAAGSSPTSSEGSNNG
jgi:hypothetical protein